MVFPIVVSRLLGPAGAVLVLVVIYSALASTISSILTSSANLLVQDIYKSVFKPAATGEQIVKYVRFTIVGLAVLAVAITWTPINTMYQVLLLTGPAVAATVWPIAYGTFNKKTNKTAATLARVFGLVVGLIGYSFVSSYAAPIFSAVTSMLITVIGTQIAPDNKFRWKMLNEGLVKPQLETEEAK
jgi:Na+/proline symporter